MLSDRTRYMIQFEFTTGKTECIKIEYSYRASKSDYWLFAIDVYWMKVLYHKVP